jgi:hypothetical protein
MTVTDHAGADDPDSAGVARQRNTGEPVTIGRAEQYRRVDHSGNVSIHFCGRTFRPEGQPA